MQKKIERPENDERADLSKDQHYFSISCDLYPHVKWGSEHIFPEIERIKGREQCQHLFLDPSSPVVQRGGDSTVSRRRHERHP